MKLIRSEKLYLSDIVEAVDAIAEFLQGLTAEEFSCHKIVRYAIAGKMVIIGEAASCVSDDLRERYTEVDWSAAIDMGIALLERYYDVDWNVVWEVATFNAPIVREQIARILAEEFPEEEASDGNGRTDTN